MVLNHKPYYILPITATGNRRFWQCAVYVLTGGVFIVLSLITYVERTKCLCVCDVCCFTLRIRLVPVSGKKISLPNSSTSFPAPVEHVIS